MSNVRIVPGKTGNVVTPYKNNADFAYVQLEQSAIVQAGGWIREVKRTTLLRGKTETLTAFVASAKSLNLPGKLVAMEYLESQVPEAVAKEHLRNDVSYEEAIESYVKTAGADGIPLTAGGERILRFTKWDPSGEMTDISVGHDNQSEVAVSKLSAGKAAFPQG